MNNIEWSFSDFLDISPAENYQLSQLMDAWTNDDSDGDYSDYFSIGVEE